MALLLGPKLLIWANVSMSRTKCELGKQSRLLLGGDKGGYRISSREDGPLQGQEGTKVAPGSVSFISKDAVPEALKLGCPEAGA